MTSNQSTSLLKIYLLVSGHVQNIEFVDCRLLDVHQGKVTSEMRKDTVYVLKLVLKSKEHDIISAECGCPAGLGLKESCKHIAALIYALYSRFQPSWKFA